MSFTADQHRDWHSLAISEGVNAWECPWDCMDGPDGEPELYAYVWYIRPGDKTKEPIGYPVFSRGQARAFATVAAGRTGKAVRVEVIHH